MTTYRYQAIGPLQAGEGSRAFLGLAISPDNKARPVVIIWVPEAAEKDTALLAKIKRETEHAAQLDHPHIVTVIGFGKLDEGHARVVEFADGESLRKVLEVCKKMPVRLATRVVLDACTAVHYAHIAGNDDGAPLVHGDVRPETVLISFQGVTKITGYGALAFAPREIGGQRVKGRRVHSAPEQIIGGRDAMTVPTDVYLLGVTFYECLTGVVPWADQGDFFDHAVLTLPLPPATPGDIPEGFQAIIEKACAKKAADRYPTPLAMREAIEAAAGGQVATDEELAAFLDSLFPQSHQVRAARRHTIDAGIADFVRRQWADQERKETQPMMRAVVLPEAMLPKTAPEVLAVPPAAPRQLPPPPPPPSAPPPTPAEGPVRGGWTQVELDDGSNDEGSALPYLAALALFVAAMAGWWAYTKAHEPVPGMAPSPRAETLPGETLPAEAPRTEPAPTEPAAIASPAASSDPDAGMNAAVVVAPVADPSDAGLAPSKLDASVDLAVRAADAGANTTVALPTLPPADAGPTGTAPTVPDQPAAPSEVAVSIESSPTVEVVLDGKVLGKTPWQGVLQPGRKIVTLQNKSLGISTTKSFVVRTTPVTERYSFEKGFVAVKAPEGAIVFIDGNRVGTAPIDGELSVYEGSHRIQVAIGQSKWSEPFTIYGGQRVSFNVELQ